MTLRQTIQAAPEKAADLIKKLSATSNQAVKTRENLFAELNDELARYVEIEEQHLLPLLRKHPETKDLAVDALKGNKDLRVSLEKLSGLPKDNDAFLAALADLNKGFQQHVRNERKELLPAVLKVLSDEEAATVAAKIEGAVEGAEQAKRDEKREQAAEAKRRAEEAEQAAAAERAAVAEAEKAKRDEKREQAAQAKRMAEEAEQAAAAERAAARAEKEAERAAQEATRKVVNVMERGATAAQDRVRQVSETLTERAQNVASDTREALTIYSDSAQKMANDIQVVTRSSGASVQAVSDAASAWMEWLGKASRANAEISQQMIRAKTFKALAEAQREYATTAMQNWMDYRSLMFQIAQRSSKQAMSAADGRLSDAA